MNRLIKSLATVMGAAALIVAPMAIVAPSAHAETLTVPDRKVQGTPEANQPAFWVDYLEDERGITGATCQEDRWRGQDFRACCTACGHQVRARSDQGG